MAWTSTDDTAPRGQGLRWPRVYTPGRGQSVLLGGTGALLAIGGLVLAGWGVAGGARTTGAALAMVVAGILVVLLGGFLRLAVRRERVLLWEDRIEFQELRRRRSLRKDEIVGWRMIPLQYGMRRLELELRPPQARFSVGWIVQTDEAFQAWMSSLPDLDAVERQRAEAELLRAPELGQTEPERRWGLSRARTAARALGLVAWAACAWAWFRPRPYPAAVGVLMAIPVIAGLVLFAGRGRYSLAGDRNDPRPNLVTPLMLPGLLLMLRALFDLRTLHWQRQLLWAVPASVAVGLLVGAADRRLKRRALALPLVMLAAAPWAWGSIVMANALLDRSPSEVHRVAVLDKHVSTGKHTAYNLRLAPWGPVTAPGDEDVGRELYEATPVGAQVCPLLRRGALGLPWFVVRACPPR